MKIGIDCRLWNETGVGRYIRNLVWELQELDKTNEYILFVEDKATVQITNQELNITNNNWKVVRTNIHWHSLDEQIKFPRILNRENLDLMHFPYFSLPIFYKRPFIVTIHDLIILHYPTGKASTLPLPLYYLKQFGYQRVLAHAVTQAKKVIVPLNAVKDDLSQTFHVSEEKITVTYEGMD